MKKTIHLLVNKVSGSNHGNTQYNLLTKELIKRDIPFTSAISSYSGELVSLTTNLVNKIGNSFQDNSIIVIGGDGSLNQAVNGLKQSHFPNTPLAYLPSGTGNDFARAVKLPHTIEELLDHLSHPTIIKVDCGFYKDTFNHKSAYFVNNLGIGFDAYVVALSNHSSLKDRLNKWHLGNLTYGLHILKVLRHQPTFSVTVNAQGKSHYFKKAYLVTTTNHPFFGGGVPILPQAKINNHLLDTIVVEKVSAFSFIRLFTKLLINGSHVKDSHFHYFESEKIEVSVASKQYRQLDGEELGKDASNLIFGIDSFNLLT
ncbi:YegS/Rv2252/BmrU family lipid kinase [Lactobacillus sp. PV037]|uniref:diacylglycerol/lipid kinase family protein n=1 Tax=unclassified Lactobacillus TaxID=2620435 RepID=UPI002240214A|nr:MULTISPECIES: YegS/Rv2252/BmrU family lipid kinase [unclassified Lactobacillus]QNQ82442.1 YegS/Rv2252/BmrU family lipid kinase [Lactobacillus sp. PV012]QNQ83444.1 YegS/Rv2252/BmrU family lipid kinase [Lactobacillus sp. PV037]